MMSDRNCDPYLTLGVTADASDADLRAAYRGLVQLHHPDHNRGSAESARRFEAVQEAYAQIRTLREAGGPSGQAEAAADQRGGVRDDVASRLADIERELKSAREASERERKTARESRQRAATAAREAASPPSPERASAEDLGYIATDDSFAKILADAASELSERVSDAREHRAPKRVSDLIDELAAKLTGEPPAR